MMLESKKDRHGAHNALIDCYYQARAVQQIYSDVGIKKRTYESATKS